MVFAPSTHLPRETHFKWAKTVMVETHFQKGHMHWGVFIQKTYQNKYVWVAYQTTTMYGPDPTFRLQSRRALQQRRRVWKAGTQRRGRRTAARGPRKRGGSAFSGKPKGAFFSEEGGRGVPKCFDTYTVGSPTKHGT